MNDVVSTRRKLAIFGGLMLAVLLAALDQTIVSTALPKIAADLGGLDNYSWVVSSYLLASTTTLPVYGKLSDIFGRRPIFIFGITLFLLGSALAGLSQSMGQLIAFRGVQGLGAGAMLPLVLAIVGDIIPPADRGRWQGLIGASFGLASIIGPTTGGWIADTASWRWVFYINLPLGLLALATVALTLNVPHERPERLPIDYLGAITVGAGIVAGLLATVWGGRTYAWGSWQILLLVFSSAVMLLAFVLVERRAADPIVPLSLFRNSVFTVSSATSLLMGVAMFGTIIYIPLFVQGVIGTSATDSGVILTPLMLSVVVASIASGFLVSRIGRYKPIAIASLAVMTVGMWLLTRLDTGSTNAEAVRDMVVVGLGLGGVMQLFVLAVQNSVPRSEMGVATSASTFFRQIGGTIGVTALGALLTAQLSARVAENLPPGASNPAGGSGAAGEPGALFNPDALAQLPPQAVEGLRLGLAESLNVVFTVSLVLTLVALLLTFFLKEIPLRKTLDDTAAPVAGTPVQAPSPRMNAEAVEEGGTR